MPGADFPGPPEGSWVARDFRFPTGEAFFRTWGALGIVAGCAAGGTRLTAGIQSESITCG
jgi:hypothetical protein